MPTEATPSPHAGLDRPTYGSAMLSWQAWNEIARTLQLSRRQLQIIRAVLDDDKESAMAATLGISTHTVHTHLERIYRRLQVHDRLELVLLILAEFLRLTTDLTSGLPPICGQQAVGKCPLRVHSGTAPPKVSPE